MSFFKGFIMSLGMFSTIPVGKNSWDDKYSEWVIPTLPLVGGVIGLIWYGVTILIIKTNIPLLICSSLILFIPFFLTGFIHIDGFMDTSDAVFSRRDLKEKRRILKDSHVGAFAVIALLCLFIFQFSAIQVVLKEGKNLGLFVLIPIFSRLVTAIALLNLKPMSNTGFLIFFKENTGNKHTTIAFIIGIIASLLGFIFIGKLIIVLLLIEVLCGILVTMYIYKELDGLSGDLCGCIITVSEVCGLLAVAIL